MPRRCVLRIIEGHTKTRSSSNDPGEKIRWYTEALRVDPTAASIFNDRGLVYLIREKWWDDAISDFNEAIRLQPDFAAAFNNRGLAYGNKDETGKITQGI